MRLLPPARAADLPLAAVQALDLCRPIPTRAAQQEQPNVTSVWPSVFLRCGQLILAALCAAALASTLSFTRSPPVEVPPPADVPTTPRVLPPLESFALITQRNLFRASGPPVPILGTLPATALDLELVGTLVVGDNVVTNAPSLALVKDGQDQVVAVREGQYFGGGRLRLISIEPRRIVIENGGNLEILALASEREENQTPAQLRARASEAPRSADTSAADARLLESLRSAAQNPPRPGGP
jgi:type II secretory pathway component PulC